MRRRLLLSAGSAAATLALPRAVLAQSSGQQGAALKIVVPLSAGGLVDRLARSVGSALAALRGRPVIVENKAGANTIIGAQQVAKAPPDGLTLLMATDSTLSINPLLYKSLPYDPVRDLAPISLVARASALLLVHPAVPATSARGFVEHVRSKPKALNYGSFGPGSSPHLTAAAFMAATGTDMTHIPYKGVADCVNAMLSGEIQVLFASLAAPRPHVRAGTIRALATLGEQRLPLLPDVPTAREAGIGDLRSSAWFGLVAPSGVPEPTLAGLEADLARLLAQPAFVQKVLADNALEPVEAGRRAFAAALEQDRRHYPAVIKATGVQLSI